MIQAARIESFPKESTKFKHVCHTKGLGNYRRKGCTLVRFACVLDNRHTLPLPLPGLHGATRTKWFNGQFLHETFSDEAILKCNYSQWYHTDTLNDNSNNERVPGRVSPAHEPTYVGTPVREPRSPQHLPKMANLRIKFRPNPSLHSRGLGQPSDVLALERVLRKKRAYHAESVAMVLDARAPNPFNHRATLETILVKAGKSPHLPPQK